MKRTGWSYAIGLAAALVMAAVWMVQLPERPSASAAGQAASRDAYSDTRKLVSAAMALMEPSDAGWKLTMKKAGAYAAPYRNAAEIRRFGEAVSARLGWESGGFVSAEPDKIVYRNERETTGGCRDSLLVAGLEHGEGYAILKRECTLRDKEAVQQAAGWQQEVDRQLRGLASAGTWNVMVQGQAGDPAASSQGKPHAERTLSRAAKLLQAEEVERYEDANTLSVSYASRTLRQSVRSAGEDVHLQAAMHWDTAAAHWRLTLGTPVITSEY